MRAQSALEPPEARSVRRQILVAGLMTIFALLSVAEYLLSAGQRLTEDVLALYATVPLMMAVVGLVIVRQGFFTLSRRLAARPDSEHQQIIVRVLLISAMMFFYYVVLRVANISDERAAAIEDIFHYAAPGAYIIAYVFALLMLFDPAPRAWRRYAANAVDQLGVAALMYLGGELSAPLYLSFLWVTFGCGFRFGVMPMIVSAFFGAAGFLAVILATPYWQQNEFMGYGLLYTLLILPGYGLVLVRSLTSAKVAAEQASQAKSRFLATISHELRTPLNAIIGVASLAKRGETKPEQRFLNQSILSSARTLLSLINNILDFSKFESEKVVAKPAPFDLHRLLAEIESMFAVQAKGKGLAFGISVSPDVPPNLVGDPDHLRGILVNLVGNGLKFTQDGHVSLRVQIDNREAREIMLRFKVTDTGIGIPQDQWQTVFESFRQGDETITRRYGGTGLGLTIVKQLVDAMGGAIDLKSEVGKGSVFEVAVPMTVTGAPKAVDPMLTRQPVFLISRDLAVAQALRPVVASLGGVLRLLARCEDLSSAFDTLQESAYRPIIILDAADFEDLPEWVEADGETRQPILIGLEPQPRRSWRNDPMEFDPFIARLPLPLEESQMLNALRMAGRLSGLEVEDDDSAEAVAPTYPRPLEILVAEDNLVNRKVIGMMLKRAGHNATLVEDGEKALDALEKQSFDLVLMDLNMPNMSGSEAAQMYRYMNLGGPPTPIVALTADATAEGRSRAADAQMDGYLLKPVEADELARVIQTYVPPHRVQTEESETAKETDTVTHLPTGDQIIEPGAIDALRELGDDAFFDDLVGDFLEESENIVARVTDAVKKGDVPGVRDGAHALRSSASHFGAHRLHDVCLSAQGAGPSWLKENGEAFAHKLRREHQMAVGELKKYAGRLRKSA